jgi:hypothetical protein
MRIDHQVVVFDAADLATEQQLLGWGARRNRQVTTLRLEMIPPWRIHVFDGAGAVKVRVGWVTEVATESQAVTSTQHPWDVRSLRLGRLPDGRHDVRLGQSSELRIDDPNVRFHLVEMIEADGPRQGQRTAWAVVDIIAESLDGERDVHTFDSVQDAVDALDAVRKE